MSSLRILFSCFVLSLLNIYPGSAAEIGPSLQPAPNDSTQTLSIGAIFEPSLSASCAMPAMLASVSRGGFELDLPLPVPKSSEHIMFTNEKGATGEFNHLISANECRYRILARTLLLKGQEWILAGVGREHRNSQDNGNLGEAGRAEKGLSDQGMANPAEFSGGYIKFVIQPPLSNELPTDCPEAAGVTYFTRSGLYLLLQSKPGQIITRSFRRDEQRNSVTLVLKSTSCSLELSINRETRLAELWSADSLGRADFHLLIERDK